MNTLAVILALAISALISGVLSWGFFGDWREGYRILSRWITSADTPSEFQTDAESARSKGAQMAYVITVVLIAISGAISLSRFLER